MLRPNEVVSMAIILLLCVSGCAPAPVVPIACDPGQVSVVGTARAFCMAFFQTDVEADDGLELNSSVGVAELFFEGEVDVLHFNLTVEGLPKVINIPIISIEGPVRQSVILSFDLDVQTGTDVSSLRFVADLTPDPLLFVGASPLTADVEPMEIALFTGEEGGSVLRGDPPEVLDGGGGAADNTTGHSNSNFPNQEQGRNECVPAAISNSMQFLNATHNLGMTPEQMSIDTWKEAVGWRETGTPATWPDTKSSFLASAGYPVTTTTSTDIADAIRALDNDCDVEIRVDGHAAALVEITELKTPGRYTISVVHDTKQGRPGGTKTDKGTFSTRYSPPGKVHGIWGMRGKVLRNFVIECPAGP